MRSYSHWIITAALLCAASTSFAEGPNRRQRYRDPNPAIQAQPESTSLFRTVYDVETAQPVPDVAYRVEYRYLDGSDTSWHTYSVSYTQAGAQQGVQWVLLHLVAEARIVEFTPQPDWERVATFDTQQAAQAHSVELAQTGVLTRVRSRQESRIEMRGDVQQRRP